MKIQTAGSPVTLARPAAPTDNKPATDLPTDTVSHSPAESSPSPILNALKGGAKAAALTAFDVVKYGALIGATAAAPLLLGPAGVLLAVGGAAAGYALHAKFNGDESDMVKAGIAGAGVGAFGAIAGTLAGPAGIAVMATLGVGGAVISKGVHWAEG